MNSWGSEAGPEIGPLDIKRAGEGGQEGVCGKKGVCVYSQSLGRVRLCDPMDCGPLGSSAHGILQARTLQWILPFPPREDLPNLGTDAASPLLRVDS